MKEKVSYRNILHQKEYMKTVIADVINRFGDSVDSLAFTWLIYQITQSVSWSAIIFGINRIPTIFLQPIAGTAIERMDKKRIIVATDIIRGLCVGVVATTHLMGALNRWLLLILTVIISCAEAFRQPASKALLPRILDMRYYEFGLSLSASASSVAELIGLGTAGIIIASFTISATIYVDMVTFFVSACIIFSLRISKEDHGKTEINVREYFIKLKNGFTYIKKNPFLLYFVILLVFLNGILVPFNSLQAPLINEVLHTDEIMLSVLGVALTLGMILGAYIYPYIGSKLSDHSIVCMGGYSIGIYYFSLILVGRYITLFIVMYILIALISFTVGIAISLTTSFCNVEFIKNIDEKYIARVTALMGAACVAAIPAVSFLVSALAKWIPTAVLFLLAGTIDISVCLKLCSRKKFNTMKEAMNEVIENGKQSGDIAEC